MNDVRWVDASGAVPDREPAATVEPENFREMYFTSLPHVYGYLLRRVGGSPAVAEDLTQETYLAAVSQSRSGQTSDSFSVPWLIGVARHKLMDHFRRLAREERKLELVVGEAASREAWEWSDMSVEQVLAALSTLPALQRAAIWLRYLDDLPVGEVARHLGRSVHATESLLARGRDGLRRYYLAQVDD